MLLSSRNSEARLLRILIGFEIFDNMKIPNKTIGWLIFSFIVVAILAWAVYQYREANQAEYPIKRSIRYSFTLQNTTNTVKKDVDFWVYAPVKQTSTQLTQSIKASLPYEISVDHLGNQVLHFKIESLPPFGTKIISINAELNLSDQSNRIKQKDLAIFLGPEKFMETEDENLIILSNRLVADTQAAKAEKLYQWVHTNIKYAGYVKDDRGAAYALRNKKGDCTEYMYLYSTLARIAGIPSRGIGGYVYKEDTVLKPEEFHNWSEVYINNAWHVVDPQNGVFMDKQSHFIAMRIISRAMQGQLNLQNTHQFAVSTKDITVRMN